MVQVELAVERLLRLGILVKTTNGLIPATEHTSTTTDIPSAALRTHHEQILEKAKQALHLQHVSERDFSSLTIAIDHADVARVKALAKKFQLEINKFVDRAKTKDRVYCLGVQFFALDNNS